MRARMWVASSPRAVYLSGTGVARARREEFSHRGPRGRASSYTYIALILFYFRSIICQTPDSTDYARALGRRTFARKP